MLLSMLFTFKEFLDLIIMTIAVGYIFKDAFQTPAESPKIYDPLQQFQKKTKNLLTTDLGFAIIATAPSVVFHELAHKFVAIALGTAATFHASYFWLVIGILLKWFNTGFVFFVPGYVTHTAALLPLQSAAIAFAGPAMNLVLWLSAWLILKSAKKLTPFQVKLAVITKQTNMFLFFFNMIPLGFFDGARVLDGLLAAF